MSIPRSIAILISMIGHPLLVVVYMLYFYLKVNPYLFPYSSERDIKTMGLIVFFTSVLIPLFSMLLMKGVGFIQSFEMKDRQERIGPLMVVTISYLWLFLNIKTHNMIPIPFARFVLGALVSLFLTFFINNFTKISLHGVGVGGFLMGLFSLITQHSNGYVAWELGEKVLEMQSLVLAMILLVISGAVLTSRLYLKAHVLQDIYGGVLVGIAGQMIAYLVF